MMQRYLYKNNAETNLDYAFTHIITCSINCSHL